MAENTKQFLGFKQVLKATYDSEINKVGYIWFVRPNAESEDGDIYFGSRHYGHFSANEVEAISAKVAEIINGLGFSEDGDWSGWDSGTSLTSTTVTAAIAELATKINDQTQQIASKVASISSGDSSITVGGESTTPTISVNVSEEEGNALSLKGDGLYVNVPEEVPYEGSGAISVSDHVISLGVTGNALEVYGGALKSDILLSGSNLTYTLMVNGVSAGTIEIPKDQFLKSASYNSGNKELVFIFETETGETTTAVDVSDLVDIYTAGNGLDVSLENEFSIKIDESGEGYLSVSENGLKLSGIDAMVSTKIAEAITGGTGSLELISSISGSTNALTVNYSNSTNDTIDIESIYDSEIEGLEVPSAVGGIAKVTSIEALKGKTFTEIIDELLFPEIQPTIQNPSATISLKNGFNSNGIYEVGAAAPSVDTNFTTSFNRGTVTCPGKPNQNRAGELISESSFIYYGNSTSATTLPSEIQVGSMQYNYHAAYSEGELLITSKGNTASVDPNPLPSGSINSGAVYIYGTYPYFCNGQNASSASQESSLPSSVTPDTKLPLIKWSDTMIGAKFASEASTSTRLEFEFPSAKNVKKVEFMNTVSGKWENFAGYEILGGAYNKEIQGKQVSYKKLTTNGALSGALQLRFTVANA